jgi:hypothetical protein
VLLDIVSVKETQPLTVLLQHTLASLLTVGTLKLAIVATDRLAPACALAKLLRDFEIGPKGCKDLEGAMFILGKSAISIWLLRGFLYL